MAPAHLHNAVIKFSGSFPAAIGDVCPGGQGTQLAARSVPPAGAACPTPRGLQSQGGRAPQWASWGAGSQPPRARPALGPCGSEPTRLRCSPSSASVLGFRCQTSAAPTPCQGGAPSNTHHPRQPRKRVPTAMPMKGRGPGEKGPHLDAEEHPSFPSLPGWETGGLGARLTEVPPTLARETPISLRRERLPRAHTKTPALPFMTGGPGCGGEKVSGGEGDTPSTMVSHSAQFSTPNQGKRDEH